MSRPIYLDHAATTPLDPAVRERMAPWLDGGFGNASALHQSGREAARAIEEARDAVARLLRARPSEIVFTSGGTESNNAAVKGVALRPGRPAAHVVTSAVEHKAVLAPILFLESLGVEATVLPVDGEGRVHPDAVSAALRSNTVLVSVMHANNEIGTLQPVEAIGRIVREAGVLFHVDAAQTAGRIPVDVGAIGCDLLSLSGHKFYGPKGVGALYVRGGATGPIGLEPLLHGGFQEEGLRSGTLNTAGIVGLGAAAARATPDALAEGRRRESALRDRLIERVLSAVPDAVLNGSRRERLPGNASFCFSGVDGEAAVIALDRAGISASTGSACAAGLLDPSHVLLAIGRDDRLARSAVRFSIGSGTTEAEVDRAATTLAEIVSRLRRRAP